MGFLRNPEVKRHVVIFLVFLIAGTLGASFWGVFFAMYVFAVCMVMGVIFLNLTRQRYDRLAKLSLQLDEVLHGNEKMELIPDEEGELAVLSSKIYKMTIRLREQAEHLKKDKIYLSDSLADISHQVKTPLTSIRLLVSRLQEDGLGLPDKNGLILKINRLLTRTEWLVTVLLKIAKLESGTAEFKTAPVNVSELIKKAAEPLEIPIELKNQLLKVEVKGDIYYSGDFLWSVEAVGNILKNCIDYTPEGGTLSVSAEENPLYLEICIKILVSAFYRRICRIFLSGFIEGKVLAVRAWESGLLCQN